MKNKGRYTPYKTPREKELNAKYIGYINYDSIIPDEVVKEYLEDLKSVKKYNKSL